MFERKFGIEIEMTGLTRAEAARVAAELLLNGVQRNGRVEHTRDSYDTYKVQDESGRTWKFMSDGSILTQKKVNGQKVTAGHDYSVELVSPILTYREDIETLQELIRRLRKAGAFTNSSVGCHIHLNGADHTVRSLRNFINIIASKNELFYAALEIEEGRMRFCKELDKNLVDRMNAAKPKTMTELATIWYAGYNESRDRHYHSSRYHFLNLHSFFAPGSSTVELRGFNAGTKDGVLHAGLIRSYIVLALALNNQALTQTSASARQNQMANPKFAMRTYLNRIGFIGDEFKNCREHLCKSLPGNSAFRYGLR